MRKWISLAVAAALTGCVTADGGATQSPRAAAIAQGQCFRTADVTNYNVEAPHAVFVLTRQGSVFGLVAEDCFPRNANTVSLARSRRGELWMCPGDQTEVSVSEWRGQGFPCLARVTNPIVDADVSGFRSRAG
ncbi:MAG: hypothetical protein KKE52_03090 [Alphaproteobacteria bacterium]|nr:hypothetical protein [Alphaproteobacteria bacterium]MBU2270268.1 hypothetical protein [Alphaproteobacteria bacterium]